MGVIAGLVNGTASATRAPCGQSPDVLRGQKLFLPPTRFPLEPIAITERMIAGMEIAHCLTLVMTVLLLVLPPSGPYYSKFRRTSSAVAYLSASQAWTLVGAILGAMGSCSKDRVSSLMPREGAKQVKKSAWLVGTNWIPELVPRPTVKPWRKKVNSVPHWCHLRETDEQD